MKLASLRWQLFAGKKEKPPHGPHEEAWLVDSWSDYVARTFVKGPNDMMSQLQKMIQTKETLQVEAHKVRGQDVKPIPSRPLCVLELAKLNELLAQYEKKWSDMGAMGQALSNQINEGNKAVEDTVNYRADQHDETLERRFNVIEKKID